MKAKLISSIQLLCVILMVVLSVPAWAGNSEKQPENEEVQKLQNPITVEYLKKNLRKSQPRLVLNSQIRSKLKTKLNTDEAVQNMYKAIKLNAESIYTKPLLERVVVGRRLLSTSREMLWRVNILGMVYQVERDKKALARLNEEVVAVCNFSDWNPSHFLDVAEMSMAVAFALDWTEGKLPRSTVELAKTALIKKGIEPSWPESGKNPGWAFGHNNWNQVCNGGMIAASIVIAEKDPELAAKTISRALDGMVQALKQYAPDGVYPEGSTYWGYGTSFSVVTSAILESSFGTDYGIADYPAFKESAVFRYLMNAPSGWYYNFADCGDKRSASGDVILAWFAAKTGNAEFFEKERFLMPAEEMGKLSRLGGAALVWLSQYNESGDVKMPNAWKGDGSNPIVVFKGDAGDEHNYYFGGKGGRATTSHGNMDAGSFIFELNDVRWVIDPGNQSYHELEKTGFDLWGSCQDCERWTLLTKNNFGHSTLSVNDQLFINNGQATLIDFKAGENPKASFDLTAVYGENLKKAVRTFEKDSPVSLVIEDKIETSESSKLITWQLLTTADVEITPSGALLKQDGKELKVENVTHPELSFSVISLDPAPMELDRQIKGLKRIELRIPAWTCKNGKDQIRIRLSEN